MEYSNSFYPLIFFICAFITLYLSSTAFHLAGGQNKYFGAMLIAIGIAAISAGFSIPHVSFSITYLWASIFYLAIQLVPVFFLSFVMRFIGSTRPWLRFLDKAIYFLPAFTLVVLATNDLHHLAWIEVDPVNSKPFWFIYYLSNGLIMTSSIALLFYGYYKEKLPQRRNTYRGIIFAFLIPWVGRAIYMGLDRKEFPETNIAPFFFAASAILMIVTLLDDEADVQRAKVSQAAQTIHQLQAEQNQRLRLEQEVTSPQLLPIKILKDRTLDLQSFYDLVLISEKAKSEDEIIQQALHKIKKLVGSDLILYYSIGENGYLELTGYTGTSVNKLPQKIHANADWIPGLNELRIDQISAQDENPPEIFQSGVFLFGLSHWVTVDQKPKGLMVALRKVESHYFSENSIVLFSAIVNGVSVILENEKIREQIIAEATNEERVRIARDMHDSIAQLLNGMLLTIDTILNTNKDTPSIKFSLIKMKDSLNQGIREMRLFFYESRERKNDTLDFPTLIRTRIQYVESHSGMGVSLNLNKISGYPPAWNTHLYMITNEALNNALLHSKANQVEINFSEEAGMWVLEIIDDGFGINNKNQTSKGYGMKNIEERCRLINADFQIASNRPQGTIVRVSMKNTGKE
ncbi:MAG TPA: histidine kinase N-terminal 7TM domain-containing protein [Anaerolineales bacterium]|nr:histidine kinase N-terminal 7TM domain-containing protein [Anaerolineales bacterium]